MIIHPLQRAAGLNLALDPIVCSLKICIFAVFFRIE